jgi:hypothetical protein
MLVGLISSLYHMPDAYGPSGAVAQRPTETKKVAFSAGQVAGAGELGEGPGGLDGEREYV